MTFVPLCSTKKKSELADDGWEKRERYKEEERPRPGRDEEEGRYIKDVWVRRFCGKGSQWAVERTRLMLFNHHRPPAQATTETQD